MKPNRIVALVLGCLLLLPGVALLAGGAALGAVYAFGRDDGYLTAPDVELTTSTAAVTAEDIDLVTDPGSPDWLVDRLDLDVRIEVTGAGGQELFVGIGPESDVDAFLSGVAHDELVDVSGGTADYRRVAGGRVAPAPADQTFWAGTASGPGTQQLDWTAESGRWAVVVMNADGSPGVTADASVGGRSDAVVPLTWTLLAVGAALTAAAVVLLVVGARGVPAVAPAAAVAGGPARAAPGRPVSVTAELDPDLSRWQWLVKWFLAIPHFVALAFLWLAFVVLTVVAGVAILFTGRYPRGIFEFNVGVLRWSWRVTYYATTGGLGTDRYPPFSLGPEPDYPATLDVAYPAHLSNGLVLVKWWLLAIPHYLVVGALVGGSVQAGAPGLLGVLVVIAAVWLLVTGRYHRPLFDLVVGLNRWIYRVIAYAALMTDTYPPFRLDQGGSEPVPEPPPTSPPAPGAVDVRAGQPTVPASRDGSL